MKAFLAAALTFALLTAPAHAQGMPGGSGAMPGSDGTSGGKHRKGTGQKTQGQEKKTKVDDKGYRSAIDRLPDQKFDPWKNAR
jgi:Spy/CpxP family protein refolding chaperone